MALIVEDGTGLADAEAYIAVADADTYFAARGNATWAALTTEQKEQALRKGADYMGATYGLRWKGERTVETQALDWPRECVYAFGVLVDSDEVPVAVQRANAELAVRASAADLLSDAGAQVLSEQVGPIAVTYAPGARQQTRFEAVDRMLQPYLAYGAGQVAVVRA